MTTELDRLLTPEPLGPQHNPSEVGSMIAAVANSARDARNQLRESVRPEVEALQARVKELEGALRKIGELDPEDAPSGLNEWGESEMFEKAQEIARESLA